MKLELIPIKFLLSFALAAALGISACSDTGTNGEEGVTTEGATDMVDEAADADDDAVEETTGAVEEAADDAAEEATDARIAQAESAAPDFISKAATITEVDGTVLREGTNGWTCMPDLMPEDNAPACHDAIWMEMLAAIGNKAEFSPKGIGISYMLQGDLGAGLSNSDPFHPDHKMAEDYTETPAHLMMIVPHELLEGLTNDPSTGGPYVMWRDTPYAHIMVPVPNP